VLQLRYSKTITRRTEQQICHGKLVKERFCVRQTAWKQMLGAPPIHLSELLQSTHCRRRQQNTRPTSHSFTITVSPVLRHSPVASSVTERQCAERSGRDDAAGSYPPAASSGTWTAATCRSFSALIHSSPAAHLPYSASPLTSLLKEDATSLGRDTAPHRIDVIADKHLTSKEKRDFLYNMYSLPETNMTR